jgi:hypothetical protein
MKGMFEEAVEMSLKITYKAVCWYPYSYLIGYLLRRAKLLLTEATGLQGKPSLQDLQTTHRIGGWHKTSLQP